MNFAVAELPSDVLRESCGDDDHGGQATESNEHDDDDNDNGSERNYSSSASAPKKKTKMSMTQKKEHNDNRNAQKQLGHALLAFHQAQTEKMKSNRESAAPRRERDLLEVFTEYKSILKETRLELDTTKAEHGNVRF